MTRNRASKAHSRYLHKDHLPGNRGLSFRLSRMFRKIFKHRKILVISDKRILSIPFSPSTQAVIVLLTALTTGWFSYTSGKNSLYQEALSEKDRTLYEKEKEITIKTLANKDLLSQVTDLHKDLMRLNAYFESLSQYDERRNTKKDKPKETSQNSATPDKNAQLEFDALSINPEDVAKVRQTARTTLDNINQNITGRIKELEAAIALTGLKLNAVTDNSKVPEDMAMLRVDEDSSAQGGPYFPDDVEFASADNSLELNKHLDSHIDYLLHLEDVINDLPLVHPIYNARITSRFGKRRDPIRKRTASHYGLDFAGPYHASVVATAPGVVKKSGYYGAYGRFIEIDHGNGISTRYGHLYKVKVKKGQTVTKGQAIGLQGNTGRSTGAHLHYEIRYKDKPYNPEKFLKAGK